MNKPLIIACCNVGTPQMSDDADENLAIFAPRILDDFYRYNHAMVMRNLGFAGQEEEPSPMERLHAVLPHVAKHYGLNKDALLQSWVQNYGMGHLGKMK